MISKKWLLLFFSALYGLHNYAQSPGNFIPVSLNNLDAFDQPGSNWVLSGNAEADREKQGFMKGLPGTGVVVNQVSKNNNSHLITREQFTDIELELDFMMAKGANSGIYLQGRYEIQLFDSWGVQRPGYSDCGGIYKRYDPKRAEQVYEGTAPLTNVAKAPGLWQHITIKFRAPRFDGTGHKTANARFESVYLNGVLVQLQAEVTGPTASGLAGDEKSAGPLMLQGDHGNVAFRNIRYRALTTSNSTPARVDFPTPIIVKAEGRPYLLRSFLNYEKKIITHGISVGDPKGINYSFDMKQGALFQVWRGGFANATDMWYERGEPYQRMVPMGSVMVFSDAPAVAVLDLPKAPWPGSVDFDSVQNNGYSLDGDRAPTFDYRIYGMDVQDHISVQTTAGITRSISIKNPVANSYVRVATDGRITALSKTQYVVGDRSYYIDLEDGTKPLLRTSGDKQELLIPLESTGKPIIYSIIW
jgi:hypothetical protein